MDAVHSKEVVESNEDCLFWKPDGKGKFSVSPFTHVCSVHSILYSLGKVLGPVRFQVS